MSMITGPLGAGAIQPPEITIEIKTSDQALHTAPTIHIDGAQHLIANDSIVKFNLVQDRVVGDGGKDPKIPVERVVCARLVMSPLVFKQLTDWLAQNAARIFPSAEGTP